MNFFQEPSLKISSDKSSRSYSYYMLCLTTQKTFAAKHEMRTVNADNNDENPTIHAVCLAEMQFVSIGSDIAYFAAAGAGSDEKEQQLKKRRKQQFLSSLPQV